MLYFQLINFIKTINKCLTKQSDKNLIRAISTGIALIIALMIGSYTTRFHNPDLFYPASSVTALVSMPALLFVANRIWDKRKRKWMQSDDFISQKKYNEERFHRELEILNEL